MEKVKAGDVCYGFFCRKCKKPMVFFKGKPGVKFVGAARITTKCANLQCGHEDVYLIDELQEFQAVCFH